LTHVLMIDDDADFIEANRTVLEAHGFTVTAAYSAQEGWDILQNLTPDVIILDVMMEEFDSGFRLANDLNIRFPKVPVLLLTAVHDFMSDKWHFTREKDADWLPVIKFLEKPLAPNQLVATIKDALVEVPPAKP
jgi:CheY-like chemotaxis protein